MRTLVFLSVAAMLTSCTFYGRVGYNLEVGGTSVPKRSEQSGGAYRGSLKAVSQSAVVCQWPEVYPGSDDPGAAYNEGVAAVEEFDCHG